MNRRISKKPLVCFVLVSVIANWGTLAVAQVPIVPINGQQTESAPPIISLAPIESVKPPIIQLDNVGKSTMLPPIISANSANKIPIIPMVKEGLPSIDLENQPAKLTTFGTLDFGNNSPPPIIVQESPASPSDLIIEIKKDDFRRPIPVIPIVSQTGSKNEPRPVPNSDVKTNSSSRSKNVGQQDQYSVSPIEPNSSSIPNLLNQNAPIQNLVPGYAVEPNSLQQTVVGSEPQDSAIGSATNPAPKNKLVVNPFANASKSRSSRQDVTNDITFQLDNSPNVIESDSIVVGDPLFSDSSTSTAQPIIPRSPSIVVQAEALYMTRESGAVVRTNVFGVDPFDYEVGVRLTAQQIFGADGPSISYTGIQEWNDVRRVTSATNGLNFSPIAGGGLSPLALAPFKGANFQQQYHNGNMHTLELNKVTWAWDVLNIYWGLRYTHYEEEFDFFSARADGQQGLLRLDMENHMFGPQVGGELFYDIGGSVSTGVKGKLGLMATALDRDTQLISNGLNIINTTDSDVNFNFMAEFGMFARWQVLPRGYIRGGYELWFNSSVFDVDSNIPPVISPSYGTRSVDDGLFIHGATIGFEYNW